MLLAIFVDVGDANFHRQVFLPHGNAVALNTFTIDKIHYTAGTRETEGDRFASLVVIDTADSRKSVADGKIFRNTHGIGIDSQHHGDVVEKFVFWNLNANGG